MEILKIVILSFSSAIILFILTKLMGNKEMSQLSMFDYIIGITIGSIAAEMSTSLENNFSQPLVAMIIYAIIAIFLSVCSNKSLKFRRLIYGNTLVLFDSGELFKNNLKKAKMDINEFLTQCRTNGYFNLNDIETAILESNGKISFLPKAEKRPANPSDLNITPNLEKPAVNVILDGAVLKENLNYLNLDELWLQKQIVSQGYENFNDIFLAIVDNNSNLSIYPQNNSGNTHDYFI